MKTRISITFLVYFLLSAFSVSAQLNLSGFVKSEAGQPIEGAKVTLQNSYSTIYTLKDGAFSFLNLKPGNYTLLIEALGYAQKTHSLALNETAAGQAIVLKSSAIALEEIPVTAVRAGEKTPTTFTNLTTKQLKQRNFGQDLPYLLESTPSTVVTSDAGGGVGYTGIRIRGVDPTRTNVTINGIPINDAESHGVYWVNMPDFASSTDNIQVQRGVGTSTNGAAAFGASINIKSDNIQKEAYATSDNSVGSFGTMRSTLKIGTGLLNNKFTVDARLSKINSNGYIDRASSDLSAFYLSGAWIGKKSIAKATAFGGKEITYQAWYGVPEAKLKGNSDSLINHFYNNYYPGGTYQTSADSINLFNSGNRTYNYYTYGNEVDHYQQNHYQLHFTHEISKKWNLNLAGHLTTGKGYYEQYRKNESFETYGLTPIVIGTDTITTTDIIRRRWLDNQFYGGIFSLNYNNLKNLKLVFGGGINTYDGTHFGEISWARYASQSEINQHYYDNNANKTELNAYVKANYQVKKWNLYADLQLRKIDYSYLGQDQSSGQLVALQQAISFTFFNPKVGFMYEFNSKSLVYGSISRANREPVRDDFIQSTPLNRPTSEQLDNVEIGYKYHNRNIFASVNYYLMNYKNQLILTGEINDVGAYNRTNVAKSYRMGIELEAGYLVLKNLSLTGNVSFSTNKIQEFNEYLDNYDNYDSNGNMIQTVIAHTNTDIAFAPSVIACFGISYEPIKHLELNWLSKYVGQQYLDNTSNAARKLDAYFISNITANYTFKLKGVKELKVGLLVNNVFNYLYENNGYTFGYISGGKTIRENYYFPQAGRNFLVRITIGI